MGKSERENELAAFEARLGAFRPGASRLDRDRVMYLAGQAVARRERAGARSLWAWPSAFAAMPAVAAALLVAIVIEPDSGGPVPLAQSGQEDAASPAEQDSQAARMATDHDILNAVVSAGPTGSEDSDLDTLLARLPAGRSLSSVTPWEAVDPDWAATSLVAVAPVSYVKQQQMLLEELMPGENAPLRQPQS